MNVNSNYAAPITSGAAQVTDARESVLRGRSVIVLQQPTQPRTTGDRAVAVIVHLAGKSNRLLRP
jgi:hypothetical protein